MRTRWTKWDWLAKIEGLASDRIAKAPPGRPSYGLAEERIERRKKPFRKRP